MTSILKKFFEAPKPTEVPYAGFWLLLMAILFPSLWIGLHTLTADTIIAQKFGNLLTYAIAGFIGGLMGFINQQLVPFVESRYHKYNPRKWKIANILCWILSVIVFFGLCFFYINQP